MTRILSTTALVLAVSTPAAFAGPDTATENNLITIQRFVSDATMADLEAMSDERVLSILNEISSGGSFSERKSTVEALFVDVAEGDDGMAAMANTDPANLTNLRQIQSYVPDATMAELEMMDDQDILAMVNEINDGENEGEIRATVRALYSKALS